MRRLVWYLCLIGFGFGAYHFTLGSGQDQGRAWLGMAGERLTGLASAGGSPCEQTQTLDKLKEAASTLLPNIDLALSKPETLGSQGNTHNCSLVLAERFLATYDLVVSTDSGQETIRNLRLKPL